MMWRTITMTRFMMIQRSTGMEGVKAREPFQELLVHQWYIGLDLDSHASMIRVDFHHGKYVGIFRLAVSTKVIISANTAHESRSVKVAYIANVTSHTSVTIVS
jgi:hypothetical protein